MLLDAYGRSQLSGLEVTPYRVASWLQKNCGAGGSISNRNSYCKPMTLRYQLPVLRGRVLGWSNNSKLRVAKYVGSYRYSTYVGSETKTVTKYVYVVASTQGTILLH